MSGATAVVLAGSRPGRDPFAEAHGTDLKALIPVGGKPMVRWPVEALLASGQVGAIRVLAQQPERIGAVLPADPRLAVEASGATIAVTLDAMVRDPATRWPLLVTTADHVLLDGDMLADFLTGSAGCDIAIGLVERAALERRLPQTRRTWLRFRGGAYSGANLVLLGSPKVAAAIDLWRSVEQDRKKGWRLLSVLGWGSVIGAALRLRTLDDMLARTGNRLGLSIRAVRMRDPLACVDVDKDADLALVEQVIAGRS